MIMDFSNLYCKIFEYGVPLEDIFPPEDIHPRVKFLFAVAYQAAKRSDCNVCEMLCYGQGSLTERFNLKEALRNDNWYRTELKKFPPGAYFWVIRQFLGLLPLPLLPVHSNGIILNWQELANACKSHHTLNQEEKEMLDEAIVKTLSKLPPPNLLMLNMLITFLRKVSRMDTQFVRRSLACLSKYFYTAIFSRPFLPGFPKRNKMLPLFNLMLVRWKHIFEKARVNNMAHFFDWTSLRSDENSKITSEFLLRNFSKECSWVFNMPRILPCILTNNQIKESSSQTDDYDSVSRNTLATKSSQTVEYNTICYLNESCAYDTIKDKNNCDVKIDLSKIDELDEEQSITLYKTALNVTSTSDSDTKAGDGFIYDDYETFKKEEFNQISHLKNQPTVKEDIFKLGWTYTPQTKSPREKFTSTPKQVEKPEEQSYVKFPDVFEEENGMSTEQQLEKVRKQSKSLKKLVFKSKISLDFIRNLMSKGSKNIGNVDTSNIKYKRIGRSNTL